MIHSRDEKILHQDKFYMYCYSFLHNFPDYILKKIMIYQVKIDLRIDTNTPVPVLIHLRTDNVLFFYSNETVCFQGCIF